MRSPLVSALLLCTLPAVVAGQAAPPPDSVQHLPAVGVTALQQSTRRDTLVLRDAALRAAVRGQELPLALHQQPGVSVTSDAGSGFGYTYLRVRGLDPTRLAVTLDGLPVSEPEDQGFYSSNLPNLGGLLGRVHLTPGLTGTAGGVAGVAGHLALTTAPVQLQPTMVLQQTAGAWGTWQSSLNASSGLSAAGWSAWGGVTRQGSNGWKQGAWQGGTTVMAGGDWLGGRTRLRAVTLLGDVRHGMAWYPTPRSVSRVAPRTNVLGLDLEERFQQGLGLLRLEQAVGTSSQLDVTVMANGLDGAYDLASTGTTATERLQLAHQWVQGLVAYRMPLGSGQLQIGALASTFGRSHRLREATAGALLYDNRGQRDELTGWLQLESPLAGGTLTAVGQLRHSRFAYRPDADAGISRQALAWTFVNPTLGWARPLTAAARLSLHAGLAHREPTRGDLFGGADNLDAAQLQAIGTVGSVRPERVFDLEAAVQGTERLGQSSVPLAWQVRMYTMQFRNEIAPIGPYGPTGLPIRRNVGRSHRSGAELVLTATPGPWSLGVTASALEARLAAYTDEATQQTYRNVRPLLSPSLLTHTTIARTLDGARRWSLGLTVHTQSGQALTNTNDPAFRLPSARWADLRVGGPVGPLELAVDLRNFTSARVETGGWAGATEPEVFLLAPRTLVVQARWVVLGRSS